MNEGMCVYVYMLVCMYVCMHVDVLMYDVYVCTSNEPATCIVDHQQYTIALVYVWVMRAG